MRMTASSTKDSDDRGLELSIIVQCRRPALLDFERGHGRMASIRLIVNWQPVL
jgi:hypothetical protein